MATEIEKIVDKILDCEHPRPEYFRSDATPVFIKNFGSSAFDKEQKGCLTPEQRVNYLFKYMVFVPQDRAAYEKFRKNSAVSAELRQRGNELYKKKDYRKALEFYNIATLFAPTDDQELGLAYANRSLILLEMSHPEEALADIDLALANNYPSSSRSKLEGRRIKCEHLINRRNEDPDECDFNYSYMDEVVRIRARVEKETKEREKVREKMAQIENPDPRIPEAADFLKIDHDEVMGRKLVVTRDVPAGTTLMVTKPYVATLAFGASWDTEHCHHCLTRIHRGIPCRNCVFALYCSEACKDEAQAEYHKFECPCLPYVHWDLLDEEEYLAFRTVCKAGPEKLLQLYKKIQENPNYFKRDKPYGIDEPEDWSLNDDPYLVIYHMTTHSEKIDEDKYFHRSKSSVALTLMLASHSDFFKQVPKKQKSGFKKFVAATIRHHMDAAMVNATYAEELGGLEGICLADFCTDFHADGLIDTILVNKILKNKVISFAWGMYPMDSFINHSCVPNTYQVHDQRGRQIIVASRALKAGEVVYGRYERCSFLIRPKGERQKALQEQFFFTCKCVACTNDWQTPPKQGLPDFLKVEKLKFSCPACSSLVSYTDKAKAEFKKKCELKGRGQTWKCGSCGKQYNRDDLKKQLEKYKKAAHEAEHLNLQNRPLQALPKLLEAIEFFQDHVLPPAYIQAHAQSLLFVCTRFLFHSREMEKQQVDDYYKDGCCGCPHCDVRL